MTTLARQRGLQAWPPPRVRPALYEGLLIRRPIAYLIDLVILSLLGGLLWLFLGLLTLMSLGLLFPLQALILALLPLAYHTLSIGLFAATPGMALLDVRIATSEGGWPGLAQALIATLLFYGSVTVTSGLILVLCLFDERSRTLHDMLSGTLGVRASVAGRIGAPLMASPGRGR